MLYSIKLFTHLHLHSNFVGAKRFNSFAYTYDASYPAIH